MLKTSNIYETRNADLATFLVFEGITLIDCQLVDPDRNIVKIRFLDEKKNCLDLERVFLNSDFKRFRDINKWILKKVHEVIRSK